MLLDAPGTPLRAAELPEPEPGPGELLLRVRACAVCRTDLHLVESDLPAKRPGVVPGHEVVGEVVAWLRATCGVCRYCRTGAENLCPNSRYTGWDADGGYAQFCVAPEDYVYRL